MTTTVKTEQPRHNSAQRSECREKQPRAKGKNDKAPVKTRYFLGNLTCQRCANTVTVRDYNEHRKSFACGICGEMNDFQEAKKRAA